MAITVNNYPADYMPVYNPIDFSVSSTNYAQANFFFIADIYINSAVTKTARLKFPAYPGQNYGHIDISGVLKQYLTSDCYTLSEDSFHKNANSILRYDVQWGEEYGPSSGVTTYNNLNNSNGYSFNGSLEFVNLGIQSSITDFANWDYTDYTNPIIFLTNSPRILNIKTTEGYSLYFIQDTTNQAYECRVRFYNAAGTPLSSAVFGNTSATVGLYDTRFIRVDVGLTNLTPLGISIPAGAAYYTAYLRDNTSQITSETFTFNIDSTCSKAAYTYRFVFKNRLGGFDSFTFNGQYQRTEEIKKDFYKSVAGAWTSNTYLYASSNRGERQFNTVGTDSFKCTSGWITQAESDWLSELIESPEVYITHPLDSTFVPVTIADSNYTYKTVARDILFNLELTFRPTFNKMRQQY